MPNETTTCEVCGTECLSVNALLTEDDMLLCPECAEELEDCINAGA